MVKAFTNTSDLYNYLIEVNYNILLLTAQIASKRGVNINLDDCINSLAKGVQIRFLQGVSRGEIPVMAADNAKPAEPAMPDDVKKVGGQ